MKHLTYGLAGALALSASALAQDMPCEDRDPGILAEFEGVWRSDGDAFGQPAQSEMVWGPVLDGCFWEMTYAIETNPGTEQANMFRGRGVHHHEAGVISGHWVDSWGAMHQLRGAVSETELTVYWGEPGGQLGRSRYAPTQDGTIQVTDWILNESGWQQFNDNRFERVED